MTRGPAIRRGLWALVAAAALLPFWELGHPLWEVDDARYAEIPREMVERGDWITPRLNYLDYVEKPPLIYWLGAASYSIFGVSEAAARLPLALTALAALAGVAWLGTWLFSLRTGLYAAALLGTCVQFLVLSHLITPDLALAAALVWASGLLLRALRRPEDARWAGPAAGACMGLALLAKGLVGALFPAVWACGLALLFPELRKGLRAVVFGWTIPAFLAVAVPWLAVMESRHPGFAHFFIVEQHFLRYLTPKYARPGPWYYFLGVDLGGLLPWTPLAVAATLVPLARWRASDARERQLTLWVALVFAFFTASSSKLPTYILPLFPHQCLLAAAFLERLGREPGPGAWLRRAAVVLGAILLAGGLLAPAAARLGLRLPPGATPSALWLAGAGLALLGAAALALGLSDRSDEGHRALLRGGLLAAAAGAALLTGTRLAPGLLSARDLGREIAARLQPGDRILCYGVYLHGLPFYTGQPVDVVNWIGELAYAKKNPANAGRFGDDDTIRRLPEHGRTVFVVMRRREVSYFAGLSSEGEIRGMQAFGDWVLAVFTDPKG